MFKKNLKSQMEILGLAIVVVLILLATVFVVRFLVLKTPTEYRKGFVSSELASNMIDTFLRTNADECRQLTMTELIQDCFQGASLACDGAIGSCDFIRLSADSVFENTLEMWKYNYEFLIYDDDINSPEIRLGKVCSAEKRSKTFPVPVSHGSVYVKLDICI